MKTQNEQKAAIKFWELKHKIDDEVARLGWSKNECIAYIQKKYRVLTRLLMSDEQLEDLLETLSRLTYSQTTTKKLSTRKERRKRRRI